MGRKGKMLWSPLPPLPTSLPDHPAPLPAGTPLSAHSLPNPTLFAQPPSLPALCPTLPHPLCPASRWSGATWLSPTCRPGTATVASLSEPGEVLCCAVLCCRARAGRAGTAAQLCSCAAGSALHRSAVSDSTSTVRGAAGASPTSRLACSLLPAPCSYYLLSRGACLYYSRLRDLKADLAEQQVRRQRGVGGVARAGVWRQPSVSLLAPVRLAALPNSTSASLPPLCDAAAARVCVGAAAAGEPAR